MGMKRAVTMVLTSPCLPLTDHLLSKVNSTSSCIEQLEKCWSQYLVCPEGKS